MTLILVIIILKHIYAVYADAGFLTEVKALAAVVADLVWVKVAHITFSAVVAYFFVIKDTAFHIFSPTFSTFCAAKSMGSFADSKVIPP